MDSFEINKIAGAVLATCLGLLCLNIAAGAVFSTHQPEKPGYNIAVKEEAPAGGPAAPAQEAVPIATRLASADIGRGEAGVKTCAACHTFNKGEPNKVGPNLFGVVGKAKASGSFNYSGALKAKGGEWTFEELDAFLQNPRASVPGTSMAFPGISRDALRADVIAYMNSKSDNPLALPKAAEAKPAADKPAAPAKTAETPATPAEKSAAPSPAPAAAPQAPAAAPPAAPAAPAAPAPADKPAGAPSAAPAGEPKPQ